MLVRKLADTLFMLRDFKNAYSILEIAKKDFQSNEKCLKYLSGALVKSNISLDL